MFKSLFRATLLLNFTLILTSPTTVFARDNTSDLDSKVEATMKAVMTKYAIPGAAVLVYENGTMHQYYFGYTDAEHTSAVNSNTLFELGSISKSFSGLLLAEQVNDDNMQLKDPLTKYLTTYQNTSPSLHKVTLLELATHSSSLPYNVTNIRYNADESAKPKLENYLKKWVSPYAPGTCAVYSNLGFGLLGQALADNAKIPLEDLLKKDVLVPLNMKSTFMTVSDDNPDYSEGYTASGIAARTPDGGLMPGSWAVKSSAEDMQKYLELAIGASDAPSKLTDAIKVAQTGYYKIKSNGHLIGLGWIITPLNQQNIIAPVTNTYKKRTTAALTTIKSPEYNPHALIDKTGSTDGFRAYIAVVPDKKTGIVILTNRFIYDSDAIENTGRKILQINLN